jgi:hypothetical protein
MSDGAEITTLEITLSRIITETGHMAVKIRTPDQFNAVEILGLIEAAKFSIYQDMGAQ